MLKCLDAVRGGRWGCKRTWVDGGERARACRCRRAELWFSNARQSPARLRPRFQHVSRQQGSADPFEYFYATPERHLPDPTVLIRRLDRSIFSSPLRTPSLTAASLFSCRASISSCNLKARASSLRILVLSSIWSLAFLTAPQKLLLMPAIYSFVFNSKARIF
ncbi:hypothetical protein BC567DRAFT_42058 [Phyllosticta citribraziliensis]